MLAQRQTAATNQDALSSLAFLFVLNKKKVKSENNLGEPVKTNFFSFFCSLLSHSRACNNKNVAAVAATKLLI
jgi:hypothetical protein